MEIHQEDSTQQLLLEKRREHADELRRLEENRETDLRMMRDRFEDLVLRQETGRTRSSQDLTGGRTNSSGSLGGGPTIAGDGISNVDPLVVAQAVDTRPTGETSRISPARMVKAPPPLRRKAIGRLDLGFLLNRWR